MMYLRAKAAIFFFALCAGAGAVGVGAAEAQTTQPACLQWADSPQAQRVKAAFEAGQRMTALMMKCAKSGCLDMDTFVRMNTDANYVDLQTILSQLFAMALQKMRYRSDRRSFLFQQQMDTA